MARRAKNDTLRTGIVAISLYNVPAYNRLSIEQDCESQETAALAFVVSLTCLTGTRALSTPCRQLKSEDTWQALLDRLANCKQEGS